MCVVVFWLGLLGLAVVDAPHPPQTDAPIGIRLASGPYFVGQAIDLVVTMPHQAAGDTRAVEPPRMPRADLFARKLDPDAPPEAESAVVARFVLVPRSIGVLTIPPFRVRVGERIIASKPTSLTVANVPLGGRTAAFLGGVGPFQVASQVEPATVRVGQPIELRITMTGPAALGSVAGPNLAGSSALPAGFVVRESSNQLDPGDPPTRTFRYRLRPKRVGRSVLPPVPLAAFDPQSRRYLTRSTPSRAIVVEAPSRFDPARIDFGPTSPPATRRSVVGPLAVAGLTGTVTIGVVLVHRRRVRRRAARSVDWDREAVGLARWASQTGGSLEAGSEVVNRLSRALERSTGQRAAVLTPLEAVAAVEAITRDGELSRRVGELVDECDRVRFDLDADATVGDREKLVAEAVAVFQAIGRQAHGHRQKL